MYVNHLNLVPVCKDICEVESEKPWSLPDVTNYKTIKHEAQVLRMTQFKTGESAIKKVKKDILGCSRRTDFWGQYKCGET